MRLELWAITPFVGTQLYGKKPYQPVDGKQTTDHFSVETTKERDDNKKSAQIKIVVLEWKSKMNFYEKGDNKNVEGTRSLGDFSER